MFLIAAIVHLEAIPGVRQDWLTRPIPRGSLLLEKFLFVVVMVEVPIFAASVVQGVANGFSWRLSLLAASSYIIFLFFFFILPILSFASVTTNMTEAFILACGCAPHHGAFLVLSGSMNESAHGTLISVTHSGIGWIGEVLRFALVAIAAGVILGFSIFPQKDYSWHDSSWWPSVWCCLCRRAAVETGIRHRGATFGKPDAGAGVEMTFNQLQQRFKSPSGLLASDRSGRRGGEEHDAAVFLPLKVAGVRNDAILLVDRVDVRLIAPDGRVLYHGTGEPFEVAREGPQPRGAPVYQQISIPMALYGSAKDQTVQVRLDYSLTLFGLGKSYGMSALDGEQRMPGWGWCKTRMNDAGTVVELRCMVSG